MVGSMWRVWPQDSSRIKSPFRLCGRTVKRTLALAWLAFLIASDPAVESRAGLVTTGTLLEEMADLGRLARWPDPAYRTIQFSSYDRRSRYDETTGAQVDWDANGDAGNYIRKDPATGEGVMAEMEGPGCIWRIWSADAQAGRVRIYLDGATEPVVDLPFIGYFDRKNEPFTRRALVHNTARGWNNYTPIPYQKSCKIVAERGWGRRPKSSEPGRRTRESQKRRAIREVMDSQFDLELSGGTTLRSLLTELTRRYRGLQELMFSGPETLRDFVNILKNGRNVHFIAGLDTPLDEGDLIALFPPAAGG